MLKVIPVFWQFEGDRLEMQGRHSLLLTLNSLDVTSMVDLLLFLFDTVQMFITSTQTVMFYWLHNYINFE